MARASRLLDLIQLMRQHRRPVSAGRLATELGVSLRTIYRDIDSLRAQGADIEGEAGIGYVLRPGFLLPPLMFDQDEVEALLLGSRWVASRADSQLAEAARRALAKIANVLPADVVPALDHAPLLVGPSAAGPIPIDVRQIRFAMRREQVIEVRYTVPGRAEEVRRLWPLALSFFDSVQILIAWCELRQDFRHFRLDRMETLLVLDRRFSPRRRRLISEWRKQQGISPDN